MSVTRRIRPAHGRYITSAIIVGIVIIVLIVVCRHRIQRVWAYSSFLAIDDRTERVNLDTRHIHCEQGEDEIEGGELDFFYGRIQLGKPLAYAKVNESTGHFFVEYGKSKLTIMPPFRPNGTIDSPRHIDSLQSIDVKAINLSRIFSMSDQEYATHLKSVMWKGLNPFNDRGLLIVENDLVGIVHSGRRNNQSEACADVWSRNDKLALGICLKSEAGTDASAELSKALCRLSFTRDDHVGTNEMAKHIVSAVQKSCEGQCRCDLVEAR